MYNNTAELRDGLNKLLVDLENGSVSNTNARARVTIAKAILDTVKVELAAAALGQAYKPLSLNCEAESKSGGRQESRLIPYTGRGY